MENKKKYRIVTLIIVIVSIIILTIVDRKNNINLSLAVQAILILYFSKTTYGCILYVKEQYKKQKYSYSIIISITVIIFLTINILRQINLLIINGNTTNIIELYNNTLESFSYFALLTLPAIIILSVYSAISNIILIKKEGFTYSNLLGVLFAIIIIICTGINQIVYEYTKQLNLNNSQIVLKKFIDISINSVLSYFYCLILATLYCNIMAARHKPKYDKDFIIILGAQIRKDGTLPPLLKGRVDKAIEFAKNQKNETNKDIIYIPSGGKGNDEIIAEAEAIEKYLIEQGIESQNIIVENKSKNISENIKFSKEKINEIKKDGKIAFSTTNYHVFRSGIIASEEGVECEGMGSKTKWYFYTNAIIREIIASIILQKKQHIILIIATNVVLLGLVLIGYFNHYII